MYVFVILIEKKYKYSNLSCTQTTVMVFVKFSNISCRIIRVKPTTHVDILYVYFLRPTLI